MHAAVGECLLNWATTELYLHMLFREVHGGDPVVASTIWNTVISMDARITTLQRLLEKRFGNSERWEDILLILEEARRRYKQRNEIAHATLLLEGGVKPRLEPFFDLTAPLKKQLTIEELRERAEQFLTLAQAITWLHRGRLDLPSTPQALREAFAQQPNDLVLALRAEAARKRKEQQERARLLRHAQALAVQGRLPDWKSEGS